MLIVQALMKKAGCTDCTLETDDTTYVHNGREFRVPEGPEYASVLIRELIAQHQSAEEAPAPEKKARRK